MQEPRPPGGEGDCFYVVGSGEFDVLATQEEKDGEVPRVLQRYTAEKRSCFGELALMYNKPLQASVRAVTEGTLWALKLEDFRGILMLSILQLSQISDSLSEVSFSSGQTIIDKNEVLALYIIQKVRVKINFDVGLLTSPNASSLKPDIQNEDDDVQSSGELSIEKPEGSYFGEWSLLGENIGPFTAVAVDDVKISQEDLKLGNNSKELTRKFEFSSLENVQLSDLEWRKTLYSTDCSEIGLASLRDSADNLLTLKKFSKPKVERLGKESQVLKEKDLIMCMSSSVCVPQVLCTLADRIYAGILLNTRLACPLSSTLSSPFSESAAQFCAASVVTALEDLHKKGVLYRGVSPDVLMLEQTGQIQMHIIDGGVLPILSDLLNKSYNKRVTIEICWIISNIVLDNRTQVWVIFNANLIDQISKLLKKIMRDIDHDTRTAARAFLNAINNANQEQTKYMVSLGCIQHICDLLLISTEKGEVFRCLLGLGRILQVSRTQKNQETKGYGQMIVQANGIDIIKKLNHQNREITTLAGKILKKLATCPTSNRKAIVIALREKLPYIQKEIPIMEKLLINKFRFQGESILTMTDYENYKVATKKAIQNAVKDAAQEMPPADNLFLFITGHGVVAQNWEDTSIDDVLKIHVNRLSNNST
ncbi:hypothetical protein OROGR_002514 [Orobanche gracilis]